MANVNYDIRKGVLDKLLTGTTSFKTAISKTVGATTFYRLYYSEVPQVYQGTSTAATPPWVAFSILPIIPERDSATKWYQFTLQFNVSALTQTDCDSLAGYLTDLMEDSEASLTIGTYQTVSVLRAPQVNLPKVDNVYNIAVQYSVIIQK